MGRVIDIDRETDTLLITPYRDESYNGKSPEELSVRIEGGIPSNIRQGGAVRVWLSSSDSIKEKISVSGRLASVGYGSRDATGIRSRLKRSGLSGRGAGRSSFRSGSSSGGRSGSGR